MEQPRKRSKQTQTGIKINSESTGINFVFAFGWPSWSLALDSLGHRTVFTHVEKDSMRPQGVLEAMAVLGSDYVLQEKEMLRRIERCAEQPDKLFRVFVQGPFDFIERIREALPKGTEGRICVACTDQVKSFQRSHWNKFSLGHAQVGGVIGAKWKFGRLVDLTDLPKLLFSAPVQASVLDYIKHTEQGTPVQEPDDKPSQVIWKETNCVMLVPCVFTKPKWVKRALTESELMDVYDLDALHRRAIRGVSTVKASSREYALAIPNRVLMRVTEWLVHSEASIAVCKQIEDSGAPEKCAPEKVCLPTEVTLKPVVTLESPLEPIINAEIPPIGLSEADWAKKQRKNDDARVRVSEWDLRAIPPRLRDCSEELKHKMFKSFDVFRRLQLRRYRHHKTGIIGSFKRYMISEHGPGWQNKLLKKSASGSKRVEVIRDYNSGMDAIHRATSASFWEWTHGSTLFFWRWPEEYRKAIRDGLEVFVSGELPGYWSSQRWPKDPEEASQLREKVKKAIRRAYITKGFVQSLIGFFAVEKGDGDIRIVYDATKSGLNEAIWAPNFGLPNAASILRMVGAESYFGDLDLGEMFLNYMLDPKLRHYAGIDATELAAELGIELKEGQRLIFRWERALMGLKSSPYNCIRVYLWSEDIIKGDRHDISNPMRWDEVRLNLPGMTDYNPALPKVYKFDRVNQRLAATICSYVDDVRTAAATQEECDNTSHAVAAKINYLGQQDAARKRESASKTPGVWAGASMETDAEKGVFASISVEKWKRVQSIIGKWKDLCDAHSVDESWNVNRKELEKDIGFLMHVTMTYDNLTPYLKGFYLTLNLWRGQRNKEGWKKGLEDWKDMAGWLFDNPERWEEVREGAWSSSKQSEDAPELTPVSTRFADDVNAFFSLFAGDEPVKLLVRGKNIWEVIYGFGDASGAGFGASFVKAGDEDKIYFRYGRWGSDLDASSSNFRELNNLVESLEDIVKEQNLGGVEIYVFTDNSTAEAAFYKGSSSVKTLFNLILRLKNLEVKAGVKIVMVHIAGTRMIEEGADGLSRGCLSEGVMRGVKMSEFIPLHLTAFERSPALEPWLRSCVETGHVEHQFTILKPEGWFEQGHDIIGGAKNSDQVWMPEYKNGNYIWAPPPAAADVCIDELRKARHKRQESTHLFVCPRIMAPSWRRQMHRSADVILSIPPGHPAWPRDMHEPLTIAIYFPFLKSNPWQLKGCKRLLDMERNLQRMLSDHPGTERYLLRELWSFTRKLPKLSRELVLPLLQSTGDDKLSQTASRKRSRNSVEQKGRQEQVPNSKKR